MQNYASDQVLLALLISFLAGISTSIGGAISYLIRRDNMKVMSYGLSFSAGVMIYISFMEILPQGISRLEEHFSSVMAGKGAALALFFVGAALTALIDQLVPEHMSADMLKCDSKKGGRIGKVGLMTALALCAHNFPEGLAVFASGLDSIALSIPIAIAITLHNIPEGVTVALPIYNATGDRKKAFWWATCSGLAEPIGAFVGFLFIDYLLSAALLGGLFALIAGIMVFISLDELLPTAQEYGNGHQSIFWVFLGMGVMAASLLFI